jgi:hypothetical protein
MPPFHKLQRLSSFLYIRSNSICVATPCIARRNLATHRDHPPSSLLDRVGGPNTSGGVGGSGPGFTPNSRGSVGPFVLGIQPSKSDEKVKKWSELSAGEKGSFLSFCVLFNFEFELNCFFAGWLISHSNDSPND